MATPAVLLVTYDFPPSLEMGAHACRQLGRHLPVHGWQPVVLTVQERYIANRGREPRVDFPGPVIRTGMLPHPLALLAAARASLKLRRATDAAASEAPATDAVAARGRARRWALSLLKTPDEYTGWIVPAARAGLAAIRQHHVAAILSSGPHWTNHLVGAVLRQRTGLPWVAHFRDPWTGIPQWKPVSALSSRIERRLERMVVRAAARVVCVTERHAELLRQLHPDLPADRVVTIPNGFDETEWKDVGGERHRRGGPFVITYAGSLYQRRNPLPVLRALRVLVDRGEVDPRRVRLDLVGWCDIAEGRRVREIAEESGLAARVTFTGPLERDETLRRLVASDLLLLLAESQPFQIPGKTYEYLRAGRPILALTSEGALAALLRKTGGAWIVAPGNDDALIVAVSDAYQRWRAGREGPTADPAQVASFDRRLLAGRLADILTTVSATAPSRAGA
jgi:glycosyltransferase involved in cell wall biosynthesis